MELTIDNVKIFKEKQNNNVAFGSVFTDRMFSMKYDGSQWHDARIHPFENISFHPATKVLHYSQTIFEGMKAYKSQDGRVLLFRPEKNLKRMNKSAERMVMPQIDENFVLKSLKELVSLERDWVPSEKGKSLYIRPTMIAMDPSLGISASKSYLFYIILSPVGFYYEGGFNPVRIYVSDKYSRAVKGGVGFTKTGGNYAASLYATEIAHKHGCQQVLWLDADQHKYVEEVGSMNIFFRFKDRVITAPTQGTILDGVTRDSVKQLIKKYGIRVEEELLSIDYLIEEAKKGNLIEVFGTGTAAIISPVGELYYKDNIYQVNGNTTGELTKRLYDDLLSYQYGDKDDDMGWITLVD